MKKTSGFIAAFAIFAFLSGCAASLKSTKAETVTLCENQRCRYLTDADSKEELLGKIFSLLKSAENKDSDLFESDPKKRAFEKRGIGFFVQGGPIPGKATRVSTNFTDVLYIDRENREIKFKILDKQTWLAVPVITATAEGILSMNSLTEIKVNYSGFTSGLVVGASGQSTEWLIDYIDMDNKVLGAHYAISIAGIGFGGGSGYQLVKLASGDLKPHSGPKETTPPQTTPEPPRNIPPAPPSIERKETVEVLSEIPRLVFTTNLNDQNNNRVLDGGEEVTLRVGVTNIGDSIAKDVHVVLSGNRTLSEYFGDKKLIGNFMPGETRTVEFKAVLPARIPSETAMLKIALRDAMNIPSSEAKILKVAMRPRETNEIVEVISEVNVDDIPLRTKDYDRKDAFALVIGISKYRDEAIPTVKYARRDAEVVARYLENVGGIAKSNIKVLTDASVTKSDLEAYIEDWLARRVGKDSTVFVYYAGHGAPDMESKEASIVPYEGHPDFPSKLYSLKKMYESLNRLPAREVIVMLDSCFSGTGGRSITKSGARPLVISMENPVLSSGKINVLAASTGSQISSDYDSVKHGLFTYFLLRGMRGEADRNWDGMIELGEIYDYVKTNVSEKASLELNRDQTPVLLPATETIGERLKLPVSKIR